jgi:hypothetical protein
MLVENDWRDSRCIVTPFGKSRLLVIGYMTGQALIIGYERDTVTW